MLHPSPQMKNRNVSSLTPNYKSECSISRPRLKVGILHLSLQMKVKMLHSSPQIKSRNVSSLTQHLHRWFDKKHLMPSCNYPQMATNYQSLIALKIHFIVAEHVQTFVIACPKLFSCEKSRYKSL